MLEETTPDLRPSVPGRAGERRRRRKTRRTIALAAGIALVAVAAGGYALVVQANSAQSAATAVDLKGAEVRIDTADRPSAEQLSTMNAVDSVGGLRVTVPTVKLDVPLGEVSVADGVLVPPGFTSVYRVRDLGVPLSQAADGTVYLVTHSARGGAVAPGNYLEDAKTGRATVPVGSTITVGDLRYSVTGAHAVPKDDLPRSDIWTSRPGTLVLITCLQNAAGTASTQNLVITAELAR